MLEKQPGVAVAMPFADRNLVEVWATKAGALAVASARATLESYVGDAKFVVKDFRCTVGADVLPPQQ